MRVHRFFERHFRWFYAACAVVCGWFASQIANSLLEAKAVAGTIPTPHVHRPVHRTPVAAKHDKDLTRNIFCSTCDPAPPDPIPVAAPDDGIAPLTTLPLSLVAVMTAGMSSSATIANTQTFQTGLYGVGDHIPGAGEIVSIHARRVHFRNRATNRVERIELIKGASPEVPPGITSAVADDGVHMVDDTHYTLDRAMVDRTLADPTELMRSARMMPATVDGKPAGWRVAAIRSNSIVAHLGLHAADIIQSVNGYDLTSPDKLLEVFSKVRGASNLSISLLRGSQHLQLDYSIR